MLEILYRDEHVVAVHKPSGLLVHRSDFDRHETRFAVQLLRDQLGRRVYPAHRLDRATSGVLLFALDPVSAGTLGRQFEANQVEKRYLAVVRGWPDAQGTIDHPLVQRFDEFGRKRDPATAGAAQPAVTDYRRLDTCELPVAVDRYPVTRYALVDLMPKTGRQHQLRRHMKHIAHPIVGDATWGKGVHNRFVAGLSGVHRLLLACTGLGFAHPQSGLRMAVNCAPGGDFLAALEALGLDRSGDLPPSTHTGAGPRKQAGAAITGRTLG